MFHAQQAMFELFYARKCQKWLKKPQKHNLKRKFKHKSTVYNFNHLTQSYIQNNV